MNTNPTMDLDLFFESIVTSYEDRIQKIQNAFQSSENITESSHNLFDHVHHSLNNLKTERELVNTRLCEILAKNGSLRKKDYHTMMSGILDSLENKEKEAESQFLHFIESQKETAKILKNSILEIKDMTSPDGAKKINTIKDQLLQISQQQDLSKQAVIKTFMDFQVMHNKMMECLESLLEKGDHIVIQDIKKIKDQIINEINPSGNLSSGTN
jgi:hypothetical protein